MFTSRNCSAVSIIVRFCVWGTDVDDHIHSVPIDATLEQIIALLLFCYDSLIHYHVVLNTDALFIFRIKEFSVIASIELLYLG